MRSWVIAAASSGGGSSLAPVAITAGGVLLGVVFTVLGSLFVANKRITELKITHAQKLQEVFLSNARDYLDSVYLPLHLAQARLAASYRRFQLREATHEGDDSDATARLAAAIDDYLRVVDDLLNRAAGAFLSPQLEDELLDLNEFLRASVPARAVKRRIAFTLRLAGTSLRRERDSVARVWPTSISLPGIMATSVEVTKVLAAPLGSKDFDEHFVVTTARVRALIKEVTLGAHSQTRA